MRRQILYPVAGLVLFGALLALIVAGGVSIMARDLMENSVLHGKTILRTLEIGASNSLQAEVVIDDLVTQELIKEGALVEILLTEGGLTPEKVDDLVAERLGVGLWVLGPDDQIRYDPLTRRRGRGMMMRGMMGMGDEGERVARILDLSRRVLEERGETEISLPGGEALRRRGGIAVARRLPSGGAFVLEMGTDRVEELKTALSVDSWMTSLAGKFGLTFLAFEDQAGKLLAMAGSSPPEQVAGKPVESGTDLTADVLTLSTGDRFLELISPFSHGGRKIGTFRIVLSLKDSDAILIRSRRILVIMAGVIFLVGVLSLGGLIRNQGVYYRRLNRLQAQLAQKEHLASLGELAGAMAHEIRNPLNAISMAIQKWSKTCRDEPGKRMYKTVRKEIQRLNGLVEDVLTMARPQEVVITPVRVIDLINGAEALFAAQAEEKGITIKKEIAGDPTARGDRAKLHQVLVNLVTNAFQVLKTGDEIRLSARREGGRVIIEAADTGPGIPAADLEKIFDFFYTTKEKGIGLGLPLSRKIVEEHGGTLKVTSRMGEGTTFTIRLPAEGD